MPSLIRPSVPMAIAEAKDIASRLRNGKIFRFGDKTFGFASMRYNTHCRKYICEIKDFTRDPGRPVFSEQHLDEDDLIAYLRDQYRYETVIRNLHNF